jgi:hypothetical protein
MKLQLTELKLIMKLQLTELINSTYFFSKTISTQTTVTTVTRVVYKGKCKLSLWLFKHVIKKYGVGGIDPRANPGLDGG